MFTFVIGKGGVGKTTVASALALWRAGRQPAKKILLISTDPAHSLADILQTKLGEIPRKLKSPGRVYACELQGAATVAAFLDDNRERLLGILEKGSLFTRPELEPLLDATLPGTSELAMLIAVERLARSQYDEVVVDTAPLGHTLRAFEMPGYLQRVLQLLEIGASRDQILTEHFGGRAPAEDIELRSWQQMMTRILRSLGESSTILVTSPELFSLRESVRASQHLDEQPAHWKVSQIVLNRVIRRAGTCPRCRRRVKQRQTALEYIKQHFKTVSVTEGEDLGCPVVGLGPLALYGRHIFEGKQLRISALATPLDHPMLSFRPAAWPSLDKPLTLTTGKGGVGKTTISAALAYRTRRVSRTPVSICSVDPAPSLDDVFQTDVGDDFRPVLGDQGLLASEVDAVAEYQRWAARVQRRVDESMSMQVRGVHVDLSFERRLLSAVLDVAPPGVDEILAIFRMIDSIRQGKRLQIDMAPTGHALEVLRTPSRLLAWTRLLLKTLARHRTLPLAQDAAVELASLSERLRNFTELLRDPARCQAWVVLLPEPLPDRETRLMLKSLKELNVPVAGLFVNRVLRSAPRNCSRCRLSWRWQRHTLQSLRNLELPVFVVPEYAAEVRGKRGLERMTRRLWHLQ